MMNQEKVPTYRNAQDQKVIVTLNQRWKSETDAFFQSLKKESSLFILAMHFTTKNVS